MEAVFGPLTAATLAALSPRETETLLGTLTDEAAVEKAVELYTRTSVLVVCCARVCLSLCMIMIVKIAG